ncbi:MAG: hypothetical protein OEL89_00120 [Candidatus Peregrinibacteria bacterium]|nr:hypothetical protein [Candidatus Peregrinibacteria bacterium]
MEFKIMIPSNRCPLRMECAGYVGGQTCVEGNYVNCDTYKISKEAQGCYDFMGKIIRDLNEDGRE